MNEQVMHIWIGQWGNYLIPKEFLHIKFTKSGWPDKRQVGYKSFMSWAESIDRPH